MASPVNGYRLEVSARERSEPPFSLVYSLAGVGALWGAAAYAVLWGQTPIFVTRAFVHSGAGLLAFLPVRLVLFGIYTLESRVVKHSFDFSRNHDWIGWVAATVGAALVAGGFLAVRLIYRRLRRAA